MPTLSYYDPRHADTYVVYLDDLGDFLLARRYIVGQRNDPIVYENLADIPQPHKANIEQRITQMTYGQTRF